MSNPRSKKVFVIDDDIIYLELLKQSLSDVKGLNIDTFTSAESCLEQMTTQPDFIVLDYYLDGVEADNMTGHDALKEFQKVSPNSKVLFTSGKMSEELLLEYEKYRSVDFILKGPDGPEALRQRLTYELAA